MKTFRKSWIWRAGKQFAADPVRRTAAKISCMGQIPLYWFREANWGDALSPVLVMLLSGKPVRHTKAPYCDRYMAIGSILGGAYCRTVVWGSGFIREGEMVMEPPKAICAVRGPLTRAALVQAGIHCPEVYGDPALLLPRFFNPGVETRFAVGIIPHYVDKGHPWLVTCARDPNVKIVDVESGICEFVRDVKSCAIILSSSLHGLICADSYAIPNAWIQLSDNVIGGHFKFHDYQESICMPRTNPVVIQPETPLEEAASRASLHPLHIDLRKLLLACPFLCQSLRNEVAGGSGAADELPNAFQSARLEEHLMTVAC